MEWSCVQLKLMSCRDLKAFNLFQKPSVYAVVSICNDDRETNKQQQRTLVDEEGGRHPEWNHNMQFDLKAVSLGDDVFLKFKLRCGGVLFGKRTIGEVLVPLKDLVEEFKGSVRFVSYQVRCSDGKPNGVLNFSYELKADKLIKQKERLYPSLDDIPIYRLCRCQPVYATTTSVPHH